jgi:putative ABC transport system permease protein
MRSYARELRQALNRLARTPTFAIAATLTLALAVGANATIFALLHRVVLNPLPYPDSDRLLEVDHASTVLNVPNGIGMTSGLFYQYSRARTIERLAIYRGGAATMVAGGQPDRVQTVRATAGLQPVLGVPPRIGRWFTEAESAPGGPEVAVISYGLWVRRFGGDPGVVNRVVRLDGIATQVIGVMPATFAFPNPETEAWMPARISPAMGFGLPYGYQGVGRLRASATVEGARAELDNLIADLPRVYPDDAAVIANTRGGLRSVAVTLKQATIGSAPRALWVLLGAMTLLLLLACANIANLMLVRADARGREVAVRRALGARVGDLARLFVSESSLLAAASAAAGLFLAWTALRALVAVGPAMLPRLHEVQLDGTIAAFTIVLSVVTAMVLGGVPAWRAVVSDVDRLDSGRGYTASRRQQRTRQLLMAGQIALALILLVSGGLMLRSYERLRARPLGFDPSSALTFRVGLPERDYPTRAAVAVAHRAILDRLAREPGVQAVSASTGVPLSDSCFGNSILVRGESLADRRLIPIGRLCAVSEDYVRSMRMQLLQGRNLQRDDVERGRTNVLVNQAFVDSVLHGEEPIGRQFRSNAPPAASARRVDGALEWEGAPPWLTIVGVVANTPFMTLTETPAAIVYMPMSIAGGPDIPNVAMLGPSIGAMTYVVRSTIDAGALAPSVQRAVQSVDRSLAVARPQTLQAIVDAGSAQMAFTMALLLIAGAVALAIGVIGIYGVVAYAVSERRREIGVRLALGAAPRDVVAMIVRHGAAVTVVGAIAGLIGAAATSRVLASLLFDVSPRDPAVFAAVTGALVVVGVIACWLPARSAASISPSEALRAD